MNTRIIETLKGKGNNEPHLSFFSSYTEKYRLGDWFGSLNPDEVMRLVLYLNNWLSRIEGKRDEEIEINLNLGVIIGKDGDGNLAYFDVPKHDCSREECPHSFSIRDKCGHKTDDGRCRKLSKEQRERILETSR